MSIVRFFGIICFSAALLATKMCAQFSPGEEFHFSGELRSHGDTGSSDFFVEVFDSRTNSVIEREPVNHGQFQFDHVPVGSFSVRLVTAPGETPLVEEYHDFTRGGTPLVLDLPERRADQPISGSVSVRDLQHPVPKKAMREAYQAQQFARANDIPKAIAKLESAIRIDPAYRDAHINLGAQYARVGRIADAHDEFQKALDIGPPAAPIYANLALTCVALGKYPDAEGFAHKALELDPASSAAQKVLQLASSH